MSVLPQKLCGRQSVTRPLWVINCRASCEVARLLSPRKLPQQLRVGAAAKGHDTRALQAYLGHKNIQHTVRYTELSPAQFKDFWR